MNGTRCWNASNEADKKEDDDDDRRGPREEDRRPTKEPAIDITDITRNLKVARKEPVKLGPIAWPKMTNILTWRGEVVQIVTAAAADGDISTWKKWIGKAMVEKPNMDAQRSSGGYRTQ